MPTLGILYYHSNMKININKFNSYIMKLYIPNVLYNSVGIDGVFIHIIMNLESLQNINLNKET